MLELFIAALVQFSVVFGGGTASQKLVKPSNQQILSVQAASAPAAGTNIGSTGWDDKN